MASDFRKQIEEQKRRSAAKYAADEMASGITPIIGKTTLAYAANEIARQRAGQAPLGDANAARAAANIARSPDSGAMIPSEKVGQANMLASMPNQGSITPFEQPADTWIQRSRDFTQSRVGGTNQQLQMQRNEMGTTDTSLTQMAAQLDPSIRQDAERARQWRIMSPQQRRDEVDRLAMEQDARTADQLFAGTWEDQQKYTRSLADPTGMFIDSYGRENPMYSPGTAERIRGYQRKIEPAIARMMSSYDRTKWDSPQAFWDAVSALPEVIEAGEFGKAIVFNIVRKYATPTMRAQMEAEDRNRKLFEQAGTKKALEEIVQKMAQDGRVNPKYANGYRLTNDGTKELLRQVWLNKDNDPRAGYIVNEIMANAPVMWMEEGGRVVQDPAHQERRRMMLEQRAQQAKAQADEQKATAEQQKADAMRAEKVRAGEAEVAARKQTNPNYQGFVNPVDGKVVDITPPPTPEETAQAQLTRRQRLGNIADLANARERLSAVQRSAKLAWQYIPSAENPNPPSIDAEIARLEETDPDSPLIGELSKARDEVFKYGATQEEVADAIAELEDIIGM